VLSVGGGGCFNTKQPVPLHLVDVCFFRCPFSSLIPVSGRTIWGQKRNKDMDFTVMWGYVTVYWVVMPCSDVVGYQRFGQSYCLHLQVVTPCSDVVGYQRFGQSSCLHLQVVTPCSDVVGYQRFGQSYCLHLHFQDVVKVKVKLSLSLTKYHAMKTY
jgi:hypothetical protein